MFTEYVDKYMEKNLISLQNILDCEKTPIKGRPKWDGKEPLCHVTSGSDGSFVFPSLPCGKYKLVCTK